MAHYTIKKIVTIEYVVTKWCKSRTREFTVKCYEEETAKRVVRLFEQEDKRIAQKISRVEEEDKNGHR